MRHAIDDSCQSLDGALATLRQRMEGPLVPADLTSRWDVAGIGVLQVNRRRKLVELFRCVEELLSNVMQHAKAMEVKISVLPNEAWLVLRIEDDGCGIGERELRGRGLRNVQIRMQGLNGSVVFGTRSAGYGTSVELRIPRF
ncbi:MAG: ATP-binding protein [Dokdonella sp.]